MWELLLLLFISAYVVLLLLVRLVIRMIAAATASLAPGVVFAIRVLAARRSFCCHWRRLLVDDHGAHASFLRRVRYYFSLLSGLISGFLFA